MKANQGPHEIAAARRHELKRMLERRRREILEHVQATMRHVSAARETERHEVRDDMDQTEVEVRYDVDLALLEIRSETVARIDEALAHLAENAYGSCADCGADIALARLAAMPFATRCTKCEQALEDTSRGRQGGARRAGPRAYWRSDGLSGSRV